ncbi:unnamed protein product [Closterium sp. NIES-53]
MKDSWSLEWICAQVLQEEFWRKKLTAAAREGGGSAYGMKGFKGCGSKKGKAKEGSERSSIMMGSVATKEASGVAATVAMGEGMGSEEGDGGAGGHGGMFYHVGVACSEDMVVPARKVALHRSSHWVINTGAFMTMTNREDLLDEARPSKAATVVSATGQVVPVRGEGRAMFIGADGRLVGLKLVILVPGLCANLLSTKALSEAGMKMEMMGTKVFRLTGCHLATFTHQLYTLATEPPQTLLWHHRLGHPSLPRLHGMHSRLLVSGLPRSLPPLPPSPAPPCLSCVEGQQRAAPHSSSFPLTTAPLQTLHMDVWGPARVIGQGRERYFLLVFDDYTWYTTVFPLRSNGQVVDVLIPLIRAVRLPLRERFRADLSVLRHHSDRGGEFSSDLLWNFCRGECILQSFSLLDSPQKNGIAEHRIGLVMEVARTSMIHAIAPDYLWPFAVGYAANQLNLWPRVSFPETSLILGWTGKVHDTSADKLSARAIPCVFLGFSPDEPGWQFYHPTSRHVFPSQDVTFDKSVPFYRH